MGEGGGIILQHVMGSMYTYNPVKLHYIKGDGGPPNVRVSYLLCMPK